MAKPPDIARLPWTREDSHAWTDSAFRALVLAWLRSFTETHSWVARDGWDVVERFTDRGISVRVQRTPPVQPAEEDFRQRPGKRVLVVGMTRTRDRERFEVSVDFPEGAASSDEFVAKRLDLVRAALVAAERAERL